MKRVEYLSNVIINHMYGKKNYSEAKPCTVHGRNIFTHNFAYSTKSDAIVTIIDVCF